MTGILLILWGDAREMDGAATVRAGRGQRCGVGLIDASRPWPSRAAAIRRAGAPPRASTTPLSTVFRERRRLAEPGATCRIELLLEPFVLALQPIAFALEVATSLLGARQVVSQPRDLILLALDQIGAIITGRRALIRHACVMPYRRNSYKYKVLDVSCLHVPTR